MGTCWSLPCSKLKKLKFESDCECCRTTIITEEENNDRHNIYNVEKSESRTSEESEPGAQIEGEGCSQGSRAHGEGCPLKSV